MPCGQRPAPIWCTRSAGCGSADRCVHIGTPWPGGAVLNATRPACPRTLCCGGNMSHGIHSLNRAVLRAGRTPHSGAPGSFTHPTDTLNPSTRSIHFLPLHCVLPGAALEPHSLATCALPHWALLAWAHWPPACVTRKSVLDFTCAWGFHVLPGRCPHPRALGCRDAVSWST